MRPASPARPGREARRDNEYERCGTANVFCAVEPKAGRHFTLATPDRSGFEFAQVAVTLALAYPEAKTIHLVMDNLNIHRRKALADVFGAEMAAEVWDRFTVHYTPTHASWVNLIECFFSILGKQGLSQRVDRSTVSLRAFLLRYLEKYNETSAPFTWTKGPEKLQRIIEATKAAHANGQIPKRRPRKRRRRRSANNIKNEPDGVLACARDEPGDTVADGRLARPPHPPLLRKPISGGVVGRCRRLPSSVVTMTEEEPAAGLRSPSPSAVVLLETAEASAARQ